MRDAFRFADWFRFRRAARTARAMTTTLAKPQRSAWRAVVQVWISDFADFCSWVTSIGESFALCFSRRCPASAKHRNTDNVVRGLEFVCVVLCSSCCFHFHMYFSQILFEHALRSSARAACPVVAAALSGHETMVHGFAVTLTDGAWPRNECGPFRCAWFCF